MVRINLLPGHEPKNRFLLEKILWIVVFTFPFAEFFGQSWRLIQNSF